QQRFDLIVIDCPPRVHTASINALAAADFLLIPVLLDLTSADSVPRMLGWVREYKKAEVCPKLDLLGVVANKKSDRSKELLTREVNVWNALKDKCRTAWDGEVTFCDTIVPHHRAFSESAQTPGRFACEDSEVGRIFNELASRLEQRMEDPVELLS
ncbi:MAG: ParA family protein, partial [Planctomycetia bacterium]